MEASDLTTSADFDSAILQSGYGRFHGMLLAICGAVYTSCAITSTSLSFVLPAAECDFRMNSAEKGYLTSMPLFGMVIGSYIWGSIADAKGRKWIIISSLLVDSFSSVFSSLCTDYYIFLMWRFISGFGVIGAISLIFSYMGEFLTSKYKDVMLCRLEIFWTLGIIILPGIAWLIIPRTWVIGNNDAATYGFNSWRIFVAICGMPSLLTAMAFCLYPESPKFLLAKGRETEAREILKFIYYINTGRNKEFYPISALENLAKDRFIASSYRYQRWYKRWLSQIEVFLTQNRAIFQSPYLRLILLTCFIDFGLIASYYTLIMWLPDLFDRFDQYQILHPNESFGVCDVTDIVVDNTTSYEFAQCNNHIDNKIFLYTLIVGISSIPTSVSLGLLIHKLGKKCLLVSSLLVSGISALGLNWVRNSVGNLIIMCFFEAFTNATETVLFCLVVDIFPTHLRALALSLTVTTGRFGAIIGNIAFGILIDMDCIVPIYTFGCLLIVSGFLCLTVPRNRGYIVF